MRKARSGTWASLAWGVSGVCEGCQPLSRVGSEEGFEGKTALYTDQLALVYNGARTALVSQGYCEG